MAQNFLGCDRDQSLLLPPDLREWLDEDHLAWFVIEAIEELDLEPFYAAYRADGHGRAAHDPKMMLTLLTYAYCVGERSSRGIERRCREDVAFRVICANQAPDHATVARFRVRHEQALARGIAADGSRRMAPGTTKPYEPPPKPEGKINTTAPDARRMKFGRNFIPAYNAQAVTTEDQIVVAAEITTEGADFEQLEPMIAAAERELEDAGVE